MVKIKEDTRYFLVREDWSHIETHSFNNLPDYENVLLLVEDKFKDICTPVGGYKRRISKYTFYLPDNIKESIKYSFNNWVLEDIDVTYLVGARIEYNLIITDPKGELRHCEFVFKNEYKQEGCDFISFSKYDFLFVLDALKNFQQIANYHSWNEYELQCKIKKLEEEIVRLRGKT